MSRRADPNDWMWAQACDLLAQAERMHRQFFRLGTSERPQVGWEPPVDVFEDSREVLIVVAMPGVRAQRVEVVIQPGVLLVRGERELPAGAHTIRQLEIPYGHFERRIKLPPALLELVSNELNDGCLTLRLRKVG